MDDLDQIYESLSEKIKWCKNTIVKIKQSNLRRPAKDDVIRNIYEYKQNCHIFCRAIQFVQKGKNPNIENFERRCQRLQFNKFELLKEYLRTLNI
jgi:hypothetical protein